MTDEEALAKLTPPNAGNLPLEITRDDNNHIIKVRINWRGSTIRQQFPWTRSVGES